MDNDFINQGKVYENEIKNYDLDDNARMNYKVYFEIRNQHKKGEWVLIVDGVLVGHSFDKKDLYHLMIKDCLLEQIGFEDRVYEM
jgi:hypothetical protein